MSTTDKIVLTILGCAGLYIIIMQVLASYKDTEREKWILQTAYALARAHGDTEPNIHLRDWARAMAETYYDENEKLGCEPLSPQEAVQEEFDAAR